MARRYFRFDGKEVREIGCSDPSEGLSAFVHGDTFKYALKHPVTGEMVDSMTRWNRINRENNLQVVGNDLHSRQKSLRPDAELTEGQILDKIHKAESVMGDPTKYRAWQHETMERLERTQRLLNGSR